MAKTHFGRKTFAIKAHYRGKKYPKKRFNVYADDQEGAIKTARRRGYVVETCKRIRQERKECQEEDTVEKTEVKKDTIRVVVVETEHLTVDTQKEGIDNAKKTPNSRRVW